jgi:hypothetical protein
MMAACLMFIPSGPSHALRISPFQAAQQVLTGGDDTSLMCTAPLPQKQAQRTSSEAPRAPYFVIEWLVGVTVDVGAALEIANVTQTFQPSGRFSAANSR